MDSRSDGNLRADTRTPLGIGVGVGAFVMVVTVIVAGVLAADVSARLVLVAIGVGVYTALSSNVGASLVSAGLGYLLFRGFLVTGHGELTWDDGSLRQLLVFALAVGLGVGQQLVRLASRQVRTALRARVASPGSLPPPREPG